MKVEGEGSNFLISEGRFLPRFVRYFAACSILCGMALLLSAVVVFFQVNGSVFQSLLAFFLSVAAVLYGIYLLYLFPDVRVNLDKKQGKASIVSRRLLDKQVRELEIRRITGLIVEQSDGVSGKNIFRIVFRTYKGENIPLSGSWTDNSEKVEADARKIHSLLDPACSLDLPTVLTKKPVPADGEPTKRSTSKVGVDLGESKPQ